jgi:recombination protein RecR
VAARPESIQKLIDTFKRLPSVGPKTAERFVMHLLKAGRGEVVRLTRALDELQSNIRSCDVCFTFSEKSPCEICANSKRDKTIVCVVAEPQDITAIEKTGQYAGVYHVLRGLIDPIHDTGVGFLKIEELVARAAIGSITEIIFGFDPTIEGETTRQFLQKKLAPHHIKLTRLATGLPAGGSVEFADEVTLSSALTNRQSL